MARIVKDADVRRAELLSQALSLFLEHGYQNTSVEQITNAVGVAKGTFYHYFATKQDLLEQLVERFTDDLFVAIEGALATHGGSAIERLRALYQSSSQLKLGRKDEALSLTRPLFNPENQTLLARLTDGWIEKTRPIMRDIIDQGCEEGTFDVRYPAATTEIWLSLHYDYGIRVSRLFFEVQEDSRGVEELIESVEALQVAEERILGVEPGTLDMNAAEALRAFFSEA